jgi:hypothetical protein
MKSPSGSIRWRKEGNLLYVKWNDGSMVSICSIIHKAYEKDTTLKRKKKLKDCSWTTVLVPIPEPFVDYTKNVGVDLSDMQLHHYSLGSNFLNIAAMNS